MHPLAAHPFLSRSVGKAAVHALAAVDYTVANRVTDDASTVVAWAYDHDVPFLARLVVHALQSFDDVGSLLISIAVWMIDHVA